MQKSWKEVNKNWKKWKNSRKFGKCKEVEKNC